MFALVYEDVFAYVLRSGSLFFWQSNTQAVVSILEKIPGLSVEEAFHAFTHQFKMRIYSPIRMSRQSVCPVNLIYIPGPFWRRSHTHTHDLFLFFAAAESTEKGLFDESGNREGQSAENDCLEEEDRVGMDPLYV